MATDVVNLTRALLRVRTDGRSEREAARLIAPRLERLGFDVCLPAIAPGRNCLIASRPGPPGVMLCGHLDTVPVGEGWTKDPFAGIVDETRIWGRGASDMKGGIAAIVCAVEEAASSGASLSGVSIVLTTGEETGCEGARALVARELLPPASALLIPEPTGMAVLRGHKGAVWLRMHAKGIAAHGSTPDLGENAITSLLHSLAALEEVSLGNSHELLGTPTLSVNRIRAGVAVNVIPEHAEGDIDVRTVAGVSGSAVHAAIAAVSHPRVEVSIQTSLAPVITSEDDPFYKKVSLEAARFPARIPEPPAAPFFTDASVLVPALAVPAVICGPGEPSQAHVMDESCSLEGLEQAVTLYTRLLQKLS